MEGEAEVKSIYNVVVNKDKHEIHLNEDPALVYKPEGHSAQTGGVQYDLAR